MRPPPRAAALCVRQRGCHSWAESVLSKSSRNVLLGPRSSGPSQPCVAMTVTLEGPHLQVLAWKQWGCEWGPRDPLSQIRKKQVGEIPPAKPLSSDGTCLPSPGNFP